MTSAAYILENVTYTTLRNMAKNKELIAQKGDVCRPINEDNIITRDTVGDSDVDSKEGERNIPRPALIITDIGFKAPVSAGQNQHDDIVYRQLIQLVDDVPKLNTNRKKTYSFWISSIRKELQANPYRAELSPSVADIYLIHISGVTPANERDYRVHAQMRAGLEVTAYVREPRE